MSQRPGQPGRPGDPTPRRSDGRELKAFELSVYARAGLSATEAVRWADAGIGAYQAESYRAVGLDLAGARQWWQAGIPGVEAAGFVSGGMDLEEARSWRAIGLRAREALAQAALGRSPTEVAARLAEEQAARQQAEEAARAARPVRAATTSGRAGTEAGPGSDVHPREGGGGEMARARAGRPRGLVARWEPDERVWVLTDWVFGPAGPAWVPLSSGVSFQADYAEAGVVSEVMIEADTGPPGAGLSPPQAEVVSVLLGPGAGARLEALARAEVPHAAVLDHSEEAKAVQDGLGRLALALEAAGAAGGAPRRAVLLIEAASLASALDPVLGLGALARSCALEGCRALLGAGAGLVLTGQAGAALERATGLATSLIDDVEPVLAARVRRRVAALPRLASPGPGVGGSPRTTTTSGHGPGQAGADPRSQGLLGALAGLQVVALSEDDLPEAMFAPGSQPWVEPEMGDTGGCCGLRVSIALAPEAPGPGPPTLWARLTSRSDAVLVAMAPLRADATAVSGLLLWAPEAVPMDLSDLVLDVVADPARAIPSAPRALFARALSLGRHAADATRAGDPALAGGLWVDTARAWEALGDSYRTGLAREYATGRRGRGPDGVAAAPVTLVADMLATRA